MEWTGAARNRWKRRWRRPSAPIPLCTRSCLPITIERRVEAPGGPAVVVGWDNLAGDGRAAGGPVAEATAEAEAIGAVVASIRRKSMRTARKCSSGFQKRVAVVSTKFPRRNRSTRSMPASRKNCARSTAWVIRPTKRTLRRLSQDQLDDQAEEPGGANARRILCGA